MLWSLAKEEFNDGSGRGLESELDVYHAELEGNTYHGFFQMCAMVEAMKGGGKKKKKAEV